MKFLFIDKNIYNTRDLKKLGENIVYMTKYKVAKHKLYETKKEVPVRKNIYQFLTGKNKGTYIYIARVKDKDLHNHFKNLYGTVNLGFAVKRISNKEFKHIKK